MMDFVPTARVADGLLRVQLADSAGDRRVSFGCVVDVTTLGAVVGVEILDVTQQLGIDARAVGSIRVTDDFHWSYDPEVDAFYLRLRNEVAPVQKSSTGIAILDHQNRIVALEVSL